MCNRVSKRKSIIAIALAIILLTGALAACSSSDVDTPAQPPPETSTPVSTAPTPTSSAPAPSPAAPSTTPETDQEQDPAPEPDEPEATKPLFWGESEVIEFKYDAILIINQDWIQADFEFGSNYHFYSDSEYPYFRVWIDTVYTSYRANMDLRDYLDGYYEYYEPDKIISKEFVSYNYLEGYEIVYDNLRDGERLYEHAFYTVLGGRLAAFVFRFPWDEADLYSDIPPYVFNSILPRSIEMNEWPSDALPKGTPEYAEGKIEAAISRNADQVNISININGTSQEGLENYLKSLEASGWTVDMDWLDGYKAEWYCSCEMTGSSNARISFRTEDESSREYRAKERSVIRTNNWPAEHLLSGTPVYPGSDMEVVIIAPGDINIKINGTNAEDLKQYFDTLRNIGWDVEEIDRVVFPVYAEGEKDNWALMGYISGTTATLMFWTR